MDPVSPQEYDVSPFDIHHEEGHWHGLATDRKLLGHYALCLSDFTGETTEAQVCLLQVTLYVAQIFKHQ
jgi:hypothetical protein